MPIVHLIVPYVPTTAARGTLTARRLALDTAVVWVDVQAADGDWTESEIDGDKAIVRVRAKAAVIANLSATWQAIDPTQHWTGDRRVPRVVGNEIRWDSPRRAACRKLSDLSADVGDDQAHAIRVATATALARKADRDGYARLAGVPWAEASRILAECARLGYGLNKISTGTFPTTSVLDSFDRSNEDPLSQSGAWSGTPFSSGSTCKVVSNLATGSAAFGNSYRNTTTYQDVEVYLTTTNSSTVGKQFGGSWRLVSPGTSGLDGYEGLFNGSGAGTAKAFRIDNESETQLGATIGGDWLDGYRAGCEMIGSTITIYKDTGSGFSSLGTRTDSTYSAAGVIGMACDNTSIAVNDYSGGSVVLATKSPPPSRRMSRWFRGPRGILLPAGF